MKVRASVKKICVEVQDRAPQGVVRVICPIPKHKQRQEAEKEDMARIAGVDLPLNKRVEIGLTYIYGIGRPKANFILEKADVRPGHAGQGPLRGGGRPDPQGHHRRREGRGRPAQGHLRWTSSG